MKENSSNPILKTKAFELTSSADLGGIMTMNGVIGKSLFLISLTIASVLATWNFLPESFLDQPQMYLLGSAIVGFVLALVISFKPLLAPFISPVYAVVEGIFLGIVTSFLEAAYPGIAFQAVLGTFAVFLAMLGLYKFQIIKVNNRFRTIVFGATAGIAIFYIISMALNFFNIHIPLVSEGIVGIIFSVFVIVIASLNLALDFDFIETQVKRGASKNMEWFAAFGLLVTLVWLYLEILKLLGRLNRN